MRNSPWYLAFLAALIGALMGYVYLESEVQVLKVTGKHIEDGRTRHGITGTNYIIETKEGSLKILEFPVIGYLFGAEEAYEAVVVGKTIEARVGIWPPGFISQNPKPNIMAIY